MHLKPRELSHRLGRITLRARAHPIQRPFARRTAATVLSRGQSDRTALEAATVEPGHAEPAASGGPFHGCRRSSPRTAVSGEVGVRRLGSFNFQAELHDVSTGGCRVELLELCEAGDRVVVRFPRLEPLGARICWAAGATAGLQLLTPVHPAVFDSLLLRLSKGETATA